MRPRSVFLAMLIACLALGLVGCPPVLVNRTPSIRPDISLCMGRICDVVVYIDENDNPTDGAGNILDPLEVLPGDVVCFHNNSGCDIDLSFPSDLFGSHREEGTIRIGGCFPYTVSSLAEGGEFLYHIYSDCEDGVGGGHTTPKVKVGEGGGEEP
jgi:hypothetical protein